MLDWRCGECLYWC